MSVFKRGLKLSKGATLDELEFSDSDSSDDDVSEKQAAEDTGSEGQWDNLQDEGTASDEDEEESKPKGRANKETKRHDSTKGSERVLKLDEAEEDDEGDSDSQDAEQDPSKIEYPVTCSLCNKLLFDLASVNQHMASKAHIKKEALVAKKSRDNLDPEKVQKLKARNERKRQRRLEKKRAAHGHVWGEHVKPEKRAVTGSTAANSNNGLKKTDSAGQPRKSVEQPRKQQENSVKSKAGNSPTKSSKPHPVADVQTGRRMEDGSRGVGGKRAKPSTDAIPPQKRRKSAGVCID